MEMKWAALIVSHMAMKQLIQKKLSFREIGKNTEKSNGNWKVSVVKQSFFVGTAIQVQILFSKIRDSIMVSLCR